MMRFSKEQTGGDLLEGCPNEFKAAVAAFFRAIESLPSHKLLEMCGGEQRIKTQLVETVAQELKETSKRVKQIKEDFIAGRYDEQVFSDNPQLTAELKIIATKHPTEFGERLFCKCTSEAQLTFWIQHIPVPREPLRLAVQLGNNIHVLHYLKEHGYFAKVGIQDKEDILAQAKRFDNEGFVYIQEQLTSLFSTRLNKN